MTAPERPAPQEPTAQEHADTSALAEWVMLEMRDRFGDDFRSNALDALLAEVERLTAERDEARRLQAMEAAATTEVRNRLMAAEALAELRDKAAALARMLQNEMGPVTVEDTVTVSTSRVEDVLQYLKEQTA